MSDEHYQKRQEYLSRLSGFAGEIEGEVEDESTRLIFMGRMPQQIEGAVGRKVDWHGFKHWLFTAMYWLVRETDSDSE